MILAGKGVALVLLRVLAKTRYQILEVLSFCDRESAKPPSLKITVLNFVVKYGKMTLSGKYVF